MTARTPSEIALEIVDLHWPNTLSRDVLVHKIASALEAERAKAKGLRDALEFYASHSNWVQDRIHGDSDNCRKDVFIGPFSGGKRAREAIRAFDEG